MSNEARIAIWTTAQSDGHQLRVVATTS
jgi:hypothetical protein